MKATIIDPRGCDWRPFAFPPSAVGDCNREAMAASSCFRFACVRVSDVEDAMRHDAIATDETFLPAAAAAPVPSGGCSTRGSRADQASSAENEEQAKTAVSLAKSDETACFADAAVASLLGDEGLEPPTFSV